MRLYMTKISADLLIEPIRITLTFLNIEARFIKVMNLCQLGISDEERMSQMLKQNPRYVLRNWMAEVAIKKAEDDGYSEVQCFSSLCK